MAKTATTKTANCRRCHGLLTDGSEFYETSTETCACPAFESGRKCYHRAAVTWLTAA